jgi:hypothetical protein
VHTEKQIEDLHLKSRELYAKCFELQEQLLMMSEKMPSEAKEHAIYGIARRLRTLRECMKFFFENLPPDLNEEAESVVLAQGNVNLHAFLINCSGINDNMAWFLAYHHALDKEMDLEKNKFDIGLFNKKFKQYLPENVAKKVEEFTEWYAHIVGHRHPTAHRIPPYVIPYVQSTDTGRIDYTPHYIHAFDKSHPVPLHAQSVCDLGAVVELVEALIIDIEAAYA